jgi:N6-L-threonylcarbamoyladenine synthase
MALDQGWHSYIPAFEYCTDNAAMIAMAAHYAHLDGVSDRLDAMPFARHP